MIHGKRCPSDYMPAASHIMVVNVNDVDSMPPQLGWLNGLTRTLHVPSNTEDAFLMGEIGAVD